VAHFCLLDDNNIVLEVNVVNNEDAPTEDIGIAFLIKWSRGTKLNWKQCSYNATIRKNFPGPGFTYDAVRDAFIAPQPFPSWILDEATCRWNAPVAMPDDGKMYQWDEATTAWVEVSAG
jgi:hypothetical protein